LRPLHFLWWDIRKRTEEDFNMSLSYARKGNFNFVIPGRFIPYPGTSFYDAYKDSIDFSLFPYKNEFKDKALIARGVEREKKFTGIIILEWGYINYIWKNILTHPREMFINMVKSVGFQLSSGNDKVRNDYI
jgi:radical SAM superfamily enzyme YgiQ (UPF0313 family)